MGRAPPGSLSPMSNLFARDFPSLALALLGDSRWVSKRLNRFGALPLPQEDIVQMAKVKLLRRLARPSPPTVRSPKAYVGTLLRNLACDLLRHKIRGDSHLRVTYLEAPEAVAHSEQPVSEAIAKDTLAYLGQNLSAAHQAILSAVLAGDGLPDRRKVFQMRQAVRKLLEAAA